MNEMLLTEEEFLAQLEAEEAQRPRKMVVFAAPKPGDRGYLDRRKRALAFMKRRTEIEALPAKFQADYANLNTRLTALTADIEAAKATLEAATDEAQREAAKAALEGLGVREQELVAEAMSVVERVNSLAEQQAAFLDEQIEFLLPFIRAHKLVETGLYLPRPYGGEELEAFLDETRVLLADESQERLTEMLNLASGGGQAAVPPKSAGR